MAYDRQTNDFLVGLALVALGWGFIALPFLIPLAEPLLPLRNWLGVVGDPLSRASLILGAVLVPYGMYRSGRTLP